MFQSSYPEVNISNNSHNTDDGGSLKEVSLQVLLMEMFFRTAILMKAHILWKEWCDRDLHLYLQNKKTKKTNKLFSQLLITTQFRDQYLTKRIANKQDVHS